MVWFDPPYQTIPDHSDHCSSLTTTNSSHKQLFPPTSLPLSTIKMKFTAALIALVSATGAVAAPAPADSVSMMAASPQWTIQSLSRSCDKADTTCTWNFKINTGSGAATACKYVVKGKPASKANGGPAKCGTFTITSGWSGQFGADKGFTTLSVVSSKKQIIYPSYTDKQLAGGKVVKPDQSYSPAALP
ncbi:hypothetical protein IWW34DRAFT_738159 [Fusarium oxysporum f. sp. albedinis]|nr:hypothetical protein IWW34DRAFT_738159 [Fusarium oxysporum f. sp. albedinis]